MAASKTLTAEQRIERARNAGRASHSPETYARRIVRDWPDLTDEQRDRVVDAIERLVQTAPPLTAAQADRLAGLLRPVADRGRVGA